MRYLRAVTSCPCCLERTTHETVPTPAGAAGEWWMCLMCGLERGPRRTEVDPITRLPLRDAQLIPVIASDALPAACAEAKARHDALVAGMGPMYDAWRKGVA